jgi:hypothetical protein
VDNGGKPVTAPELGPDKVAVFAKSLPQRRDMNLEIGLLYHDAGPNHRSEFILRDERAGGLYEDHEEIEGARTEFDRHAAGEQPALPRQHSEPAELERRIGCSRALLMLHHRRIIAALRLPLFSWLDQW